MAASFLGPESYAIIVDREKFEKELWEVLNKALSSSEGPPKEKHVRSAMIATWREKGCSSLWKVLRQFPLLRGHIVCWKACFVIHRAFRDGHTDVVKKSAAHIKLLSDIGKHWGHAVAGYAPLITAYVRVLMKRIAFAVKNPEVPGNFNFEEKPFKVPTDIDYTFQLCVELFEVQSSLLHLYAAVLTNLDPSRGVSAQQIQCKLAPLIPAIQDSAVVYDIVFKLMKALHSALPAETLSGHRERFNRQYHALRKYFMEASKMKYLQTLVKIPSLAPDPPSFLLPGQLIEEELAKQVQRIAQQDEETSLSSLVELAPPQPPPPQPAPVTTPTNGVFDQEFGNASLPGQFDFSMASPPPRPAPKKDDRDALIEQLMREIVELKEQRSADHELIASLRERVLGLEAEINDYKQIAEDACNENLLLKRQIEDTQSEKGAQSDAVEARAKAVDEKFTKLREVYQKLRAEHISLLRTNGEISKKLLTTEKSVLDGERENQELEQKVMSLALELDEVKVQVQDESAQMAMLRDELRKKETQSLQLEKVQRSLSDQLEAKEKDAPHTIVVQAVEETKEMIKDVIDQLPTHANSGATCSLSFLSEQTKSCMDVIDKTTSAFSLYSNDPTAIGKAVSVLASFSHSLSDVMLQGAAASHMMSAEDGQSMVKASEAIGQDTLAFLDVVKSEKPGSGAIASSANKLQSSVRGLERKAIDLAPPIVQEDPETLGDLVDEEMSATAHAVEAAALRIQEMLKKSREDDSGVKLEVNERILDSCTDLMKAIKVLIARSKDLQSEIVGEGMGTAADTNEFYKKNSRWSEGLISASKQVGWGASMLVDAADKVVQRTGKFEELVVASHDIAASTAQLVAASRVKARPKSDKLKSLKSSSRAVSEATGQVVASATSGSQLQRKASENSMDYSKLSLTQAKRLEMESQVKALELEKELQEERTRLAELRKFHYHLAGASEGWEVEEQTS